MNREAHVRFWERPGVKFLRATRPTRMTWALQQIVGHPGHSGRDADVVEMAALDRGQAKKTQVVGHV